MTEAAEVDAAIGVCMLYRRDMAEELGGYDPGFSPVWFDDVDLSLSMRRLNLKVFYLADIQFVHRLDLSGDRALRTPAQRMSGRLRRAAGVLTPQRVKRTVSQLERRVPEHPPHELKRLRHHYAYWRKKWGFDLLNPDMDDVLKRYGGTEICWRYDPGGRAAGERISPTGPVGNVTRRS